MRILLIEHLTASPLSAAGNDLAREGWAMLAAAARDASKLTGVRVAAAVHADRPAPTFNDEVRRIEVSRAIDELSSAASGFDGVLIIAPEIDGIAESWTKRMEASGARLLSPPSRFVRWASDKLAVARTLPEISPRTESYFGGETGTRPSGVAVVVKPRDGVGGMFVRCTTACSLMRTVEAIRNDGYDGELVVQPRIPGFAASVAVIGRRRRPPVVLPVAAQKIEESEGGGFRRFSYVGGEVPIPEFDRRAHRLVERLWASVEPFDGWFGIDLIFSDDGGDVIVDVNPRLTTSYLGYSKLLAGTAARLLIGRDTEEDLQRIRGPFDARFAFDPTGRAEIQPQRA